MWDELISLWGSTPVALGGMAFDVFGEPLVFPSAVVRFPYSAPAEVGMAVLVGGCVVLVFMPLCKASVLVFTSPLIGNPHAVFAKVERYLGVLLFYRGGGLALPECPFHLANAAVLLVVPVFLIVPNLNFIASLPQYVCTE